ncbi:hypothetical protein HAX54_029177, partial [Datura stramonium]|nr:hypothetical protein [Datura stramonium]
MWSANQSAIKNGKKCQGLLRTPEAICGSHTNSANRIHRMGSCVKITKFDRRLRAQIEDPLCGPLFNNVDRQSVPRFHLRPQSENA